MAKKKRSRYKHVGGKPCIEVKVKSDRQLFDARDPSPFRERDLDDDFVEYYLSSAREFSFHTDLKLIIHIDEEIETLTNDSIKAGIYDFFQYKIDLQKRELKSYIKRAQYFLVVGLIILFICLYLANLVPEVGILGIFKEGLVIFGWVSLWKPIELVLFDWEPLYANLKLFRKLLGTEIEIIRKQILKN
jgi:hypothetical protein